MTLNLLLISIGLQDGGDFRHMFFYDASEDAWITIRNVIPDKRSGPAAFIVGREICDW